MKRLLAVSWEMPPMYGPRAAQVAATLAELGARGWRSTVVCLDPRRGGPHWPDGVAAPPLEGVQLRRVASPEEWLAWRVAARVAPILRQFPDNQWVWTARAVAAARRALSEQPHDGLITFAQPWSDHLIGLRARRGARMPWVAHFSDPWVDSPYARGPRWQQRMWRRMERDVIGEADALVFVSAETADLVMRKYPDEWRRKVAVVPHGFVPFPAPAGALRRPGPMRLVYTGRFYSGVRTPSALLRALASLNRRQPLAGTIEVVFMGPFMEAYQRDARSFGLEPFVRFESRRPRREAERLAADADVLLVIDAPSDGPSVFLSSKLVDYLAFRKPILGLTPSAGTTARLLARLGSPIVSPDDEEAIASSLLSLIDRWRGGALTVSPAFDAVAAEFDIRRTTADLDDVLTRTFGSAA